MNTRGVKMETEDKNEFVKKLRSPRALKQMLKGMNRVELEKVKNTVDMACNALIESIVLQEEKDAQKHQLVMEMVDALRSKGVSEEDIKAILG